MPKGITLFSGLAGYLLRSGEYGSAVDIGLSKQWSELANKNSHPFGSYNLANIAMLDGDLPRQHSIIRCGPFIAKKSFRWRPCSNVLHGEIDFQVIPTNVPRALECFKI